jgi:uncharacterized lipoprotein YmbA
MPRHLLPLLATALVLAGCGDRAVRYLVEPTPVAAPVALRVGSVEVLDLVLPEYAEAPEILQEGPDGGLTPIKNAIWGDGTARSMTARLAESLGLRTTAAVAAEPWPLEGYPDARLAVRVDRIVARAEGSFEMAGQFALASPDRRVREFLERFSVSVPITGKGAGAVAAAKGAAVDRLADTIVARLRR